MHKLIAYFTIVAIAAATAQPAVEHDTYLNGAWGHWGTNECLELYRKVGFNMVQPTNGMPKSIHGEDFQFIGGVAGKAPRDVARPFETADGKLLNAVGLFTHVNFSAPSVADWWKTYVPTSVKQKSNTDRYAFWKVHNEFGYHSGELFDYSEGSISLYRQWLKQRYDNAIAQLNRVWQSAWKSFDEIEPPRKNFNQSPDILANWLEWKRFTACNFSRYFHETGDLIRTVVPNAKVSDNFYYTNNLDGWDLFELARETDYMALDLYSIERWDMLGHYMDLGRDAARGSSNHGKPAVPFLMMEYHAGPNDWINAVYAHHLYTEALMTLARECRAIQWYMWHPGTSGREEGIHGLVDITGDATERVTAVARINAFLRRFAPLFKHASGTPRIGVVISADSQYYQRAINQNIWKYMNINNNLSRLLTAAGFSFQFLDAIDLANAKLDSFDVILVGGCPVLSDVALNHLKNFAAPDGKAVILCDDAASLNQFGQKRDVAAIMPSFKHGSLLMTADTPALEAIVKLARRDNTEVSQKAADFSAWLTAKTGIRPDLMVSSPKADTMGAVDLHLLKHNALNIVFIAAPDNAETLPLTITLPQFHQPVTGWFYTPDTATAVKLNGHLVNNNLTFELTLDGSDGRGGIILFGSWQPVVDIATASGQDTFRPGEQTVIRAGVVNYAPVAVSGDITLSLPNGWKATPVTSPHIANLGAGQRAEISFSLTVPADAKLDFFAVEHRVTASFALTEGMSGTVSTIFKPFVKPTLDLRVDYRDKLLNPWQRLTPPILRWGWHSEVATPPPSPLAINGDTAAKLLFDVRQDLIGKPLKLSVRHADGTPAIVKTASTTCTAQVPVVFDLPKAGDYELTATIGDISQTVTIPAAAGSETAQRVINGRQTADDTSLMIGVSARHRAQGTPVSVALPEGFKAQNCRLTRMSDNTVIACDVFSKSITFNADVPASGVSLYRLSAANETKTQPRVTCRELPSDNLMVITGDSYRLTINTLYGWFISLELKQGNEWKPFFTERTGPVIIRPDGSSAGPETSTGLNLLTYTFTNASGVLEFERPLDNGDVCFNEKWTFEPNHLKCDTKLVNRGKKPYVLRSLSYELGTNSVTAPAWTISEKDTGTVIDQGTLPISALSSARQTMLFKAPFGASLAVTLRRCAQNMTWAAIANAVSHTSNLTRIDMVRQASIDPGDFILSEFDFWPSTDNTPAIGDPELEYAIKK